ncbi:trypsin-like peptidase domain-containing protein [Planococcus sp. N028]|uniref:Trypsin-like peptidase domain-containing protein n=1 Tax=Planococcus shixiaomingii TaxID=3058393 RepID=A0ABT8N1J2_9BACL|nr:trypsin-like peptidase domain-containing protein [Planococcus sp. N028]MDN7241734.1 trypsin-like peptidase domain-containing protein [Planococcus sp. N028]
MNKRLKNRKSAQTRKRIAMTIFSLVLLAAIGLGGYFLIATSTDSSAQLVSKEESFAGKTYAGFKIAEEDVEALKPPEAPIVGTVKDVREEKTEPPKEEAADEPEETEEAVVEVIESAEPVVAPKKDLSSTIANAKSYVYTMYTDLEQGSGFLFNSKGDILTNAHVVKDASYVVLTNSDGQEFTGQVIGISETTDVALVRVEELAGKEPMEMEMSQVDVGTEVFALGSPENISNTATEGEITGVNKNFSDDYEYKDLYEMNATIKKGSSGGPLIAAESERILGINSIILEKNPKIGYAIPIYTVIDQINEWVKNPIQYEEDEVVLPDVKDAHFDKELLQSFIEAYYELIPYSLNDQKIAYYQSYLLPGSQGESEGKKLVEELAVEDRIFDIAKPTVKNIEIGEEEATIEVEAVFTFHSPENDETAQITHKKLYTVIIDEFGDYQIETIENKPE